MQAATSSVVLQNVSACYTAVEAHPWGEVTALAGPMAKACSARTGRRRVRVQAEDT